MATKDSIVVDARKRLRDFPRFFQTSFEPAGRTYNLGKPNIDDDTLWVAFVPNTVGASVTLITDYSLDARGGNLRLATLPDASKIMVEGNYYEWLLPEDLDFAADLAIHELSHGLNITLGDLAPAVGDLYSLGTIVEALHNLLNEYARDIDVITSESVHIIASQRYRMVAELLGYYDGRFKNTAAMLNLGLDRLEVLTLRRTSRTTGRLVPIYLPREMDDIDPIVRIWPPIDDGVINLTEDDELRTNVYVDGTPPQGVTVTGTVT